MLQPSLHVVCVPALQYRLLVVPIVINVRTHAVQEAALNGRDNRTMGRRAVSTCRLVHERDGEPDKLLRHCRLRELRYTVWEVAATEYIESVDW